MFNSVIGSGGLNITSMSIIVISAIILGLVIAFVHMITSKYSKNYVVTLAILPILVSTVMIMVNGNLGTGVAIAGAFSLVRFRSLPGNSREIISVFWAMAIGIAIGMGQVIFASIITIVVGLLILIFYKSNFLDEKHNNKILDIIIPENLDYDKVFDEVFNKYVDNYELLKIKTTNLGSLYELKYEIMLKSGTNIKEFIDDLRVRNGNLKISLHKSQVEEVL